MSETPKEIIAKLLHDEGVGSAWSTDFLPGDIIAALTASGYVIVPKEATLKMIGAGLDAWDKGKRSYTDQWTAMISASQGDRP